MTVSYKMGGIIYYIILNKERKKSEFLHILPRH